MTTVLYCTELYCTVLNHTFTSLADTYLLIKLFMLGPLDKKFADGWWHCNYSFKLQGTTLRLVVLIAPPKNDLKSCILMGESPPQSFGAI